MNKLIVISCLLIIISSCSNESDNSQACLINDHLQQPDTVAYIRSVVERDTTIIDKQHQVRYKVCSDFGSLELKSIFYERGEYFSYFDSFSYDTIFVSINNEPVSEYIGTVSSYKLYSDSIGIVKNKNTTAIILLGDHAFCNGKYCSDVFASVFWKLGDKTFGSEINTNFCDTKSFISSFLKKNKQNKTICIPTLIHNCNSKIYESKLDTLWIDIMNHPNSPNYDAKE